MTDPDQTLADAITAEADELRADRDSIGAQYVELFNLHGEAKVEIAELRAENERLRAALEQVISLGAQFGDSPQHAAVSMVIAAANSLARP